MSAAAVIDCLEFARAGSELRGSVSVTDLQRLDDILFDSEGRLDYELRGSCDARNRPQLELKVSGFLHLACQRCLGSLDYEIDLAATLLLATRDVELGDEIDDPDGADFIEAAPDLEITTLVEDEMLLSLPLAPRHPVGVCSSRLPAGQPPESMRPFVTLAALKNSGNTR